MTKHYCEWELPITDKNGDYELCGKPACGKRFPPGGVPVVLLARRAAMLRVAKTGDGAASPVSNGNAAIISDAGLTNCQGAIPPSFATSTSERCVTRSHISRTRVTDFPLINPLFFFLYICKLARQARLAVQAGLAGIARGQTGQRLLTPYPQ